MRSCVLQLSNVILSIQSTSDNFFTAVKDRGYLESRVVSYIANISSFTLDLGLESIKVPVHIVENVALSIINFLGMIFLQNEQCRKDLKVTVKRIFVPRSYFKNAIEDVSGMYHVLFRRCLLNGSPKLWHVFLGIYVALWLLKFNLVIVSCGSFLSGNLLGALSFRNHKLSQRINRHFSEACEFDSDAVVEQILGSSFVGETKIKENIDKARAEGRMQMAERIQKIAQDMDLLEIENNFQSEEYQNKVLNGKIPGNLLNFACIPKILEEDSVFREYNCVIGQVPIRHPVIDPTSSTSGEFYERSALKKWLREHNNSPKTREHLEVSDLAKRRKFKTEQNKVRYKELEKVKKKINDRLEEYQRVIVEGKEFQGLLPKPVDS